ncbi:hypothetical protein N624_0561 [Levilactobacillus brevis]|nr:hypothetical protein N624_0561 [Levilactobacillus brevis]
MAVTLEKPIPAAKTAAALTVVKITFFIIKSFLLLIDPSLQRPYLKSISLTLLLG